MKQGRRCIRNTVVAAFAVALAVPGLTRLYASTVDAGTPEWQRRLFSLGLVVRSGSSAAPATAPQPLAPGDVGAFKRLIVEGDIEVEITGAAHYTARASGEATGYGDVSIQREPDGTLRLAAGPAAAGLVVRVEAPALESIEARRLRALSVSGLSSPELVIRMQDVAQASLQPCSVGRWILHSDTPLMVRLNHESAAPCRQFTLQVSGNLTVHYGD